MRGASVNEEIVAHYLSQKFPAWAKDRKELDAESKRVVSRAGKFKGKTVIEALRMALDETEVWLALEKPFRVKRGTLAGRKL